MMFFRTDALQDSACCDTCQSTDAFVETEHPRGQPENAGEFATKQGAQRPTGEASKHLQPAHADRTQWPEHVQHLKVPPAWRNVHISPDPDAALQVMGMDAKNRWQPIYHPRFMASQAEAKFARVKELDDKFTEIQQQNEQNRRSDDPDTRAHADAAALVMSVGLRPGSEGDTGADSKSFGATTLLGHHIIQQKRGVRLRFVPGKHHGEMIDLPVDDPSIAKMLIGRAAMAGSKGPLFPNVSAGSLSKYVHGLSGGFLTKDFRTLLGTRTAVTAMQSLPSPTTLAQYKKSVREVAKIVAAKLANTPVVALQSYVNPTVFAPWQMGV